MKGGGGPCLLAACVSVAARVPETRFPPSLTLGPSLLALGRSEAEELSASSLDLGVQRRRRRQWSEGIREAGPGLRRRRAKRGGGGNYYNSYKSTKGRRARRDEGIEKMEEEESSTNVRGKKEGRGGGGKGNLEFPVHRRSSSSSSSFFCSLRSPRTRVIILASASLSPPPCFLLLRPPQTLNTHMCTSGSLQSPEAKEEKKSRRGEKEIATNTLGSEESCCDCYPWWTGFLVGGWRWLLAYERGKGEEEENQLEEEPASETGEN